MGYDLVEMMDWEDGRNERRLALEWKLRTLESENDRLIIYLNKGIRVRWVTKIIVKQSHRATRILLSRMRINHMDRLKEGNLKNSTQNQEFIGVRCWGPMEKKKNKCS